MKRIEWIDYAKAFAIFGMMIIHLQEHTLTKQILVSFRIPLLFIISGFLFSYKNNPQYSSFTYKRFRQLLVPYYWINILSYLAWLLVFTRIRGTDNPTDFLPWHFPLKGFVLGIPSMLVHNIPLWSLISFFMVEIIFYPLAKYVKTNLTVVSLLFLFSGIIYYTIKNLGDIPFALGPSIIALPFYALGHFIRQKFPNYKIIYSLRNAVIALPIFCLGVALNTEVNFYLGDYGNFLFFIIGAVSGSYIVCYIAYLFSKIGLPHIITFISKSTLIICGFHLLVYAAIKGVILFVFKLSPEMYLTNPFSQTIFALCSFFVTLPIAYIIRRYFRPLVDK